MYGCPRHLWGSWRHSGRPLQDPEQLPGSLNGSRHVWGWSVDNDAHRHHHHRQPLLQAMAVDEGQQPLRWRTRRPPLCGEKPHGAKECGSRAGRSEPYGKQLGRFQPVWIWHSADAQESTHAWRSERMPDLPGH